MTSRRVLCLLGLPIPERRAEAIPFGSSEAILAADLYRCIGRARSREIDLAIAACAIMRGARLWTQNVTDFSDIPGLTNYTPV